MDAANDAPGMTALDTRGRRRYRRLLAFASAAILWERLWPRLWPAACVAGTFVACALLDVLPGLPDWLHASVLVLFAVAFLAAFVWAQPACQVVSHAAARSRIERDNALIGRPLAALEDDLVFGHDDPIALALWRRHRERMVGAARRLRVRLPQPNIARHEPWGVRAGVLLLLAIGVAAGHADAGPRLLRAIDPGVALNARPPSVELWITPQAYTGVAPMFFATAGTESVTAPVRVPHGSAVLVRAEGIDAPPTLRAGSSDTPFTALAEASPAKPAWRAGTSIEAGSEIAVYAGRHRLAAWPIEVIADLPPQVAFSEPPAAAGNGLLGLAFEAHDDYGVTEIAVEIAGRDTTAEPGVSTDDPLRVTLPLTTPGATSVTGTAQQDLSAHRLAGLPAVARLVATDASGQTTRSEAAEFVLPERTFSHPVARAIAQLRKRLFAPTEETRATVAQELGVLAEDPQRFANDVVVTLALSVARNRLIRDQGQSEIASVRDLLWQTALRIEQGEVPLAERRLDEARQRLVDALQRKAGEAEIEQLMDDLQQALDNYLEAAAAELARRDQQPLPLDLRSNLMRSADLKDLIETARQLARSGGREGAMRMLSELQRLLDGVRSALRSDQARDELAKAQALMQGLRELADRQQSLLDETLTALQDRPTDQKRREPRSAPRRLSQQGEPGRGDPADGQPSAGRPDVHGMDARGMNDRSADQQALRQDLGELALRLNDALGSIPGTLGEADQSMRGAARSLSRGRLDDAASAQTRAVDALTQALDAAGQAIAQHLGPMLGLPGQGGEEGGEEGGETGSDIFGRQPDGRRGFSTGTLSIPERANLNRAQEILDELRRRAAEHTRPRQELDYIERLLRRF
jgi:uncharacterized protein (TIGR02302 family)